MTQGWGLRRRRKGREVGMRSKYQQIMQALNILPEMWKKGKNKQENTCPRLEDI